MQGSWNEMKSYRYEYLRTFIKEVSHTWNLFEGMPFVLCLAREMRNATTAWKQVNVIQTAVVWESDLMFWELVISAVMEMLIKYVTFNMQFWAVYWQMTNRTNVSWVIAGFGEDGLPWVNCVCICSWNFTCERYCLVTQVLVSHINSLPITNTTRLCWQSVQLHTAGKTYYWFI